MEASLGTRDRVAHARFKDTVLTYTKDATPEMYITCWHSYGGAYSIPVVWLIPGSADLSPVHVSLH